MVSPGGRDGPSDNRGPAHMDKMKKTAPPKTRRSLPAYLNRNHPNASNQEPSTPPTSLHGPNTLPLGPPPSHQMAPPTSVLGLFDAAGGSPFVGSSNVAEGSPAARSSNVADGSTAVANSVTGGGSHTAANSVTSGVSPAAGNSSSSTNTAAPRRQAPRRRATLEAPRDESGRFVVVLSSDYKIIDNHLATVISNIFEEYPQVAAYTYKSISKDVINQYWEEFQKKCVWNRSSYSNNVMKGAFIDKLKNRYKGILNDVRKAERQPVWCPDDVWQSWARMWSSPEFKRRSARAKKARGGKDGVPKGTHTGGSCSHAKTAKKLCVFVGLLYIWHIFYRFFVWFYWFVYVLWFHVFSFGKEMNQPITPHQLFLWTHTHEHDGITFINDRSKHTQEQFEDLTQERVQTAGTIAYNLTELEAFYRASGGLTRGRRIFGLGTAASQFYGDHLPTNTSGASSSGVGEASTSNSGAANPTLHGIQEHLDRFNADRARFIDYLDRVEGQGMERPRSDDDIHLNVDVNEIRDRRERLTDLETAMGPYLRQIQISITQLQDDVQRIDRFMGSGSSRP